MVAMLYAHPPGRWSEEPYFENHLLFTIYDSLFSVLHSGFKDLLDYLRVRLFPAAEVIDGKRHLNMSELFVRLIESVVGDCIEMVFDESFLGLLAPEILYEGVHHSALFR